MAASSHVRADQSAVREQRVQPDLLRPRSPTARGESRRATLPCEGTNTDCSGPWTAVYMDGFAGLPRANQRADDRTSSPSYPDEAFCTTSAPTATEKATADCHRADRWVGLPTQRRRLRHRRRLPLSRRDIQESRRHERQPVLLHDHLGAVLLDLDANGWGTGPAVRGGRRRAYVSYGAGGFDPRRSRASTSRRRRDELPTAEPTRRRWRISRGGTRSPARGYWR